MKTNTLKKTPTFEDVVAFGFRILPLYRAGYLFSLVCFVYFLGFESALLWSLPTLFVTAIICWRFTVIVWKTEAAESLNRSGLGIANWITLTRGLLIAILAGMLALPHISTTLQTIIGILYSLAAIADFLDGYVARKRGESSPIGEHLDGELDAIGIFIVPLLGIKLGQLPFVYILVSLAFLGFQAGIYYRERRGLAIFPLAESEFRRTVAGFQMGFLAVVLYPVYQPPGTFIAAYVFMAPFLAIFLRDWLNVSGRMQPGHRIEQFFSTVFQKWLPLLLRGVIVIIVTGPALQKCLHYDTQVRFFQQLGVPAAEAMVLIAGGLEVITVLLILFGVAGRYAALCLMFIMGSAMQYAELNWGNGIALVACIYLAIFGTGVFSLHQAWEKIFVERINE